MASTSPSAMVIVTHTALSAQADARPRTVQVQGRVVEAGAGRHHHRPAVADQAEMRGQDGGEDGDQLAPVRPAQLAEPAVTGSLGA